MPRLLALGKGDPPWQALLNPEAIKLSGLSTVCGRDGNLTRPEMVATRSPDRGHPGLNTLASKLEAAFSSNVHLAMPLWVD